MLTLPLAELGSYVCDESISILEASSIIDNNNLKSLLVTQNDNLLGILSDGDIRKGILHGHPLKSTIRQLINTNPIHVRLETLDSKVAQEESSIIFSNSPWIFIIPLLHSTNNSLLGACLRY